jgi:TPR repeat protein
MIRLVSRFVLLAVLATQAMATGLKEGLKAYERGDYQQAALEWLPLAQSGDGKAQHYIATLYFNGLGVETDVDQALDWLRQSAEEGNTAAQHDLGWLYFHGVGVEENYPEALIWMRMAADNGVPAAQTVLGWMYANGAGVPLDYTKAAALFEAASEMESGESQFYLANLYLEGKGVRQSLAIGRLLLRKSRANGFEKAGQQLSRLESGPQQTSGPKHEL